MVLAREIFQREKALIGMVHVAALPGTPRNTLGVSAIVRRAVEEAKLLAGAGFDAVLIENMHDVPYLRKDVGPEIVAAMTSIAAAVRQSVPCPVGVQILAGANREALAVAHTVGGHFIRAENFVFSAVADEGLFADADAGPLLRYRKAISAEGIRILADVKKKHAAHAITADINLVEAARAAEFFGADAIVLTGSRTGDPVQPTDVEAVRVEVDLPIVIGSGVTPDNIASMFAHADALIVGSWYKQGGKWDREPDVTRVRQLAAAAEKVRK